jgi:hypothetical protein
MCVRYLLVKLLTHETVYEPYQGIYTQEQG